MLSTSGPRFSPHPPAHPLEGDPCVTAGLSYVKPGEHKPFSYASRPPPGTPWENAAFDRVEVPIRDARRPGSGLRTEGFELWDAPSQVADFLDAEAVQAAYYPEAAELALAATGASRAFVFDHLLRRRDPAGETSAFGRHGADGVAAVNGRIHNDYTEASGQRRLALVLRDADLAAGVQRYGIVNIWRSIRHPVLDTPLAVCDARSVGARDLIVGEVRYPHRNGEIYFLAPSPRHRWWYFSAMSRDEALVFTQYDSQVSGTARFTPHCAFDHPAAPLGHPPRESMEVRCLVVYD